MTVNHFFPTISITKVRIYNIITFNNLIQQISYLLVAIYI